MAIEFIVEDGTGLSTATSYVSIAEFQQYWTNRGTDYTSAVTYPEVTLQGWLNEATAYADLTYCWGGSLSDDDQALAVPRIGWVDVYGRDLDASVPDFLKNGVCELAGKRKGVDPEASASVGIAAKRYGPVSVSYRGGGNGKTIKYPTAEKWFNKMMLCGGLKAWPL